MHFIEHFCGAFAHAMNKEEHIKYWIATSASDWKAVQQLVKGKNYVQSLFFAHLVLEKILKAYWVKDNASNHPPKTHNLVALCMQTKLKLNDDDLQFLAAMNDFQLEGRYPDYIQGIYKNYNSTKTRKVIERVTLIRKCLLKELL